MKIVSTDQLKGFDYITLPINDMAVKIEEDAKTGRKKAVGVTIQGETFGPTNRFWVSLFSRYGINNSLFKYYDHSEVFNRISEKEKNDRIRVCVERHTNGKAVLQGVNNPDKAVIGYDEMVGLLEKNGAESATYNGGIIESYHTPRVGSGKFDIGGDEFVNKFVMATPIDGYGNPNIYLSMMRLICVNGVVGYSKLFKSGLAIGKGHDDVAPTILRAMDGFNSDEGYAAIRERVTSATKSWASVYETTRLYKLLVKLYSKDWIEDNGGLTNKKANYLKKLAEAGSSDDGGIGSPILKAYHTFTGDTSKLYGLANLEALSVKRQRTLPTKATIYDVINFTTELATHYATPAGGRELNAYIGETIAGEYDLEGTVDVCPDFQDFLISRKLAANLTGSENTVAA